MATAPAHIIDGTCIKFREDPTLHVPNHAYIHEMLYVTLKHKIINCIWRVLEIV